MPTCAPIHRQPDQLRPIVDHAALPASTPKAPCSSPPAARTSICAASVEDRVPPFRRNTGKGWVTAEYGMLPRATNTRTTREASTGKVGGRTQEIQRLIGRSLRSVAKLDQLGERTIWVDCDVIQADGGTRTAAITGGFVALVLALQRLREPGQIKSIPSQDYVAATSVGIIDGVPMLDLAYDEDSRADVDMNVVQTGDGRFIELQGTAEADPFGRDALDALLALADSGIRQLVALQREIIGGISAGDGAAQYLLATTNAGKVREIRALLAGTAHRARRAWIAVAGIDAARGNGRHLRRERAPEGPVLRARHRPAGNRRRLGPRDRRDERRARHRVGALRRARHDVPGEVRDHVRALRRAGAPDSPARFVCALALADGDAIIVETRGTVEGHIAPAPGRHGRLRLRPDLLLPALRLHARRGLPRTEGRREPSRRGVQGAAGLPGGSAPGSGLQAAPGLQTPAIWSGSAADRQRSGGVVRCPCKRASKARSLEPGAWSVSKNWPRAGPEGHRPGWRRQGVSLPGKFGSKVGATASQQGGWITGANQGGSG